MKMTKSKNILIKNPLERFWKFVAIPEDENDCWEWTGRKNYKGYGVMKINSRNVQVHRFSYEIHSKAEIPAGLLACHKCDNPVCVNPSHIFIGTVLDNNLDRDRKGRKAVGERNGRSRLTESDIRKIKYLINSGVSDSEIARRVNLWSSTIRAIRVGITWSHIQ